jgi:hypothetical protein
MLSVRPPAFTISGFAVAKSARTILASSLTVNPCARNVSSVHPCGLPARISKPRGAARRSGRGFVVSPPPLHAGQALAGRLLSPIRPRVGADDAAALAMRGPNAGTGTSSAQRAALMIVSWWHR